MTAENSRPGRDTGTADEQRGDDAQGKYGAPCPDCAAVPESGHYTHDPTCPLLQALDRAADADERALARHSRGAAHQRPVTPAEATFIEMQVGWRPRGDVRVTRHTRRRRSYLFSNGDKSVTLLDIVGGGGHE